MIINNETTRTGTSSIGIEKRKMRYLFLIHPQSEGLFNELLTQANPSDKETFQAMSLSSGRSLLLASENQTPFMAKLSLDATIGLTENNLGEISGISSV